MRSKWDVATTSHAGWAPSAQLISFPFLLLLYCFLLLYYSFFCFATWIVALITLRWWEVCSNGSVKVNKLFSVISRLWKQCRHTLLLLAFNVICCFNLVSKFLPKLHFSACWFKYIYRLGLYSHQSFVRLSDNNNFIRNVNLLFEICIKKLSTEEFKYCS